MVRFWLRAREPVGEGRPQPGWRGGVKTGVAQTCKGERKGNESYQG